MQIYKNGEVVYTSIDNTGSTDDAALGARYAKGRLDTLDSRFDDYISKEEMLDDVVTKDDFVTEATEKTSGIEIVLSPDSTASSIPDVNINDSAEMKYSTVHTSSNNYINTKLDALNDSLVGKMNLQFVSALPSSPERNTQYYVETAAAGTWDIYIVDNTGTVHSAGTTDVDLTGIVRDTRKIAGISLDADISAQQIEDATKSLSATLTNKSIDASENTVLNLTTSNLATNAITTSISGSPVDTKLTTEKSIYNYAVPKTSTASQIYGSSSNYTLSTSIGSGSTAAQIPTAKSIYDYAVPKTSTANQIYGSSSNYALSTAIGSSSTATQIPTAKSIYDYAVPKTSTANRVYGTNSSGGETQYAFSDTYTSTATNQMFTRAGAYNLYNAYCAVSNGTVTLASGWNGSIKWVRSGKVVTMYGEMNRTGSKINSWAFTTIASTLPTELRPKAQSICNGFSDYTANVTALNNAYVNNEIVITTAGVIQINPRNSIGIQTGDFLYWHITYITA